MYEREFFHVDVAKPGVETIDVATCQKLNMRAMVLWTINDFLARSSLSGWSGQGYKACLTCNEDTPSTHGDPPRKFNRDDIMAQLARLPTRVKGKHPMYGGVKIKRNVLVELKWTKQSMFYKLEYWSFLTLKHNLGDRKKFCQFIEGVKLPDGFGSNFKPKVTDNDTNITALKSHDCHIMMQRLLPYGLQQYLPADDDMLKAQSKVVDILCNHELIYPPGFFDIMIHLVINLPLEALEGEPIRPRWMYPFERFMKKLKNYVRNKAKPKGSIAEGYVTKEELTFSSHYFRDVTMKFNRPDRNVDCPPPTCIRYQQKDKNKAKNNKTKHENRRA
ncbi:reverse transcriptase domain-containing protein [Tanacetum coccineum]